MSNFQSLMRRADTMRRIETDYLREAWWTGYIKGTYVYSSQFLNIK